MSRRCRHHAHRCGGFFTLDAVVALGVVMTMTLVVGGAAARSHHAARALADRRAATRIAERVLAGESADAFSSASVRSHPLGDGWVRVTVQYQQASAALVGREVAP